MVPTGPEFAKACAAGSRIYVQEVVFMILHRRYANAEFFISGNIRRVPSQIFPNCESDENWGAVRPYNHAWTASFKHTFQRESQPT